MRKRILSFILAVLTVLSLCAPAFASAELAEDVPAIEAPAEPAPDEVPVEPEATTEPEATAEPETTAEPEATAEPEMTAEPEATAEPEMTAEPEATAEPEMTAEPEATDEPEETASGEPSDEPAPAAQTVSAAKPSAAIRKAAQTVFDAYYDAYYNDNYGKNDLVSGPYEPFWYKEDFSYAYYDLDKNGVPELFISSGSSGAILGIYEFVSGKAVKQCNVSTIRESVTLLSDGRFKIQGSLGMSVGTAVDYFTPSHYSWGATHLGGYDHIRSGSGFIYKDRFTGKTLTAAQVKSMDGNAAELTLTGWTKFLSQGMKRNGLVTSGGKTYCYKSNVIQTGWQTLNSKKYYFSTGDGHMLTGIYIIDGQRYYFSVKDGAMLTGIVTVDNAGHKSYFSAKDGHRITGVVTVDNKGHQCYFSAKTGYQLKGLVTTNAKGTQRYFSVKTGYMLKNGWYNIGGGKKALINASGVVTKITKI